MARSPKLTSYMVAEVMNTGRAIQASPFLLKYILHTGKKGYKGGFSFIAPKKSFKTAVARNQARRRGRSALKALEQTFSSKDWVSGGYFVFLLKPNAVSCKFSLLVSELEHVLLKGGILSQQ